MTTLRLLAITVPLGVLLSACGGGADSSGAATVPASNGLAGTAGRSAVSGAAEGSVGGSATKDGVATIALSRLVLDSRKLIRTATLDVAVADVDAAVAKAEAAVAAANGAVYNEDVRHDAKGAVGATLTLKVPPASYSALLTKLATGLGTELNRTQKVADVTEDVVDVAARLDVQRRAIARIKALLDQASRIGDVVSLEGELSTREAAFESLQARQRTLAAQTDLATITATLQRQDTSIVASTLNPKPKPEHGFLAGLKSGWAAFTATTTALATVLGALLPFVPLVALVAGGVLVARRRRRPLVATGLVD